MTAFVTSDSHFGHTNIIKYCNRPFKSVEEMDAELQRRWNEIVTPDDVVYHLGDVCLRKSMTSHWARELNGQKYLILGNHDRSFNFMEQSGWRCLTTGKGQENVFADRDRRFRVAHRPRDLRTWNKEDEYIVLCGHEHNNAPVFIRWARQKNDKPRVINAMNMCVEHWGFAPVPLRTVIETYDKYMAEVRAHRL